jgi:hypothetical protein
MIELSEYYNNANTIFGLYRHGFQSTRSQSQLLEKQC